MFIKTTNAGILNVKITIFNNLSNSQRKLLNYKLNFKKNNIMILKAPKHFKAGKNIVKQFNSKMFYNIKMRLKTNIIFLCNNSSNEVKHYLDTLNFFRFLPEEQKYKLSVTGIITVKFIGWYFIFKYNY